MDYVFFRSDQVSDESAIQEPENNTLSHTIQSTDSNDEDIEEVSIPDLQCPICNKKFTRTENIVVHLTSIKHRAKITSENRLLAAQLYTKYHSELLKKAAFQCNHCSFAAMKHADLVIHLKSQQHNENILKLIGPLECVQCNFLDYSGAAMLEHCLGHQNVVTTVVLREKRHKIKCQECGKILHSTLHYSRHLKQHYSTSLDESTPHKQCDFCPFKGKRTTVNEHMSRTHRNYRPYSCKVCNSDFHAKYDLAKHLTTKKHLEQVFDDFKCVYRELNHEMEAGDHGYQKVLLKQSNHQHPAMRCKFCPYSTTNLAHLQTHYVSHHEQACPVGDDEQSIMTQSGVPLLCRFCNQQIFNKSDLCRHEVGHILKVCGCKWSSG